MSPRPSVPVILLTCLAMGLLPGGQERPATTLDTVLQPTVIWCESGVQCLWDVTVRFGLPVGIQVEDLVDFAAPQKRSPLQVPAGTVRDFLERFVAQNPNYVWREVGGFAVLRSYRAWRDGEDALNRPVAAFDLDDVTVAAAFIELLRVGGFHGADLGGFSQNEQDWGDRFSVRTSGGPLWKTITDVARASDHFAWKVQTRRVASSAFKKGHECVPPDRDDARSELWVYRRPRR